MKVLLTILKVFFQNIIIVLVWLLLAPFLAMLITPLPWWLFGIVFVSVTGVYFLLLFFSNAELFKWVKNDYVWSMSTGILTLFCFFIPSIMWVSHNTLYQVLKSVFT